MLCLNLCHSRQNTPVRPSLPWLFISCSYSSSLPPLSLLNPQPSPPPSLLLSPSHRVSRSFPRPPLPRLKLSRSLAPSLSVNVSCLPLSLPLAVFSCSALPSFLFCPDTSASSPSFLGKYPAFFVLGPVSRHLFLFTLMLTGVKNN